MSSASAQAALSFSTEKPGALAMARIGASLRMQRSIAAGSFLCTVLPGERLIEAAERWTEVAIHEALGGLPDHKRHCSALAATALLRAADQLANPKSQAAT